MTRRPFERGAGPCRRFFFESLETRRLLSTFVVTTTVDDAFTTGPPIGSLRDAIVASDANPAPGGGANLIVFDLSTSDPGYTAADPSQGTPAYWTITLNDALPEVTAPTTIDGLSQPGTAGGPSIVLSGINTSGTVDGLDISAGRSAVLGLVISQFRGVGIQLEGAGNDLVGGCYIGTDITGMFALQGNSGNFGNGQSGVYINGTADNTIGGVAGSGLGNVLSGNGFNGVAIQGDSATGNLILGNDIGVSSDGNGFLGNDGNGVLVNSDASGNEILDNVISSNNFAGVFFYQTSANLVAGNIIGTDTTGDQLSNLTDGVFIIQSADNTIGGTSALDRNVISSNDNNGVSLRGPASTGNLVQGNFLGTDPTGTQNLGDVLDGVYIQNAAFNTIGGTAPGAGNLISGDRIGVDIETVSDSDLGQESTGYFTGGLSDGNLVEGNRIGTDVSGTQALGNSDEGVLIVAGSGNTVGGSTPGAGNLIVNNLTNGVGIEESPAVAPTIGNVIQGNVIGLDVAGNVAAGNREAGVYLLGALDTLVGGPYPGDGNVISGNGTGVAVSASTANPGGPLGVVIQGNVIGLGADGQQLNPLVPGGLSLRNTGDGIALGLGAAEVYIGGTAPGSGNVISGNGGSGIGIVGAISGVVIDGNLIGVARDGLTSRPNEGSGVSIADGSQGVTVGGTALGSGNVISGNMDGVMLSDPGTSGDLVEANLIGVGLDGSTMVGNLGFGVLLLDGVSANTIGGTSFATRNVISGNGQGVGIVGPDSTDNIVDGNVVGLDVTGEVAKGNLQLGVIIDEASGNLVGPGNVISGNAGVGVELFGPESLGNLVAGNIIGLDATGSRNLGNVGFGVQIEDAPGNEIGGTGSGERNTISGNRQSGILVSGSGSGDTFLQGNIVGLDATGRVAIGNAGDGIQIDDAPLVVVGGPGASALNVISGNTGNGVEVDGSGSVLDQILGNFIGTNATGLVPFLGNGGSGVVIASAPGVVVGGSLALFRNVISGNAGNGVDISGVGSIGTQVEGNLIGLAATGEAPLGNGEDGVLLDGTVGVTIGGTPFGSGDVISGNSLSGVELSGPSTSGDVVEGDLIGTDATGKVALGNSTGVLVNGSPYDVIGGSTPGSGNIVSGNALFGVELLGSTALGDAVEGNRIGTDPSGEVAVANQAGVYFDGAPSNLVLGNLISGNASSDLILDGLGASGNFLIGNLVGVDATGTRAVGPMNAAETGILILDAPGNVVGGTAFADRNIVSGNGVGINIAGFDSSGNVLLGNYIGTNASGTAAVANAFGVYVNGSPSNVIGGSTAGSGNLISGNTSVGVDLYGTLATGNLVQGNVIGTNIAGTAALPNSSGVYIELADSNTIGGPTSSAGNLISGNSVAGVYIYDMASGNVVQENRIGVSVAGKPLGNLQYGVLLYDAPNNTVDMSKETGNLIANSGIGNYREFSGTTTSTTSTSTQVKAKTVVKASHPAGPKAKVSSKSVNPRGSAGGSPSTGRTGG